LRFKHLQPARPFGMIGVFVIWGRDEGENGFHAANYSLKEASPKSVLWDLGEDRRRTEPVEVVRAKRFRRQLAWGGHASHGGGRHLNTNKGRAGVNE